MPVSTIPGAGITSSTTLTTPIVATTLGVGGATPAASGAGITFPATLSASSNANTLDDYEEGTFTVALSNGGTIGNSDGTVYVKIGRCVYFQIYANSISGIPNNSSAFYISGMPFAAGSSSGVQLHGNAVITYSATTNTVSVGGGLVDNTSQVYWHRVDGCAVLSNANMTGCTQFICAGFYMTS